MENDPKDDVPEGFFDPEAELQKYLREKDADPAYPKVAEPNYDAEMKLDAKAIAEGIRAHIQTMYPGIEVNAKLAEEAEEGSPHPTLESLQESLSHVDAQLELALTQLRKDRGKVRERNLTRALIQSLRTGRMAEFRDFVKRAPDFEDHGDVLGLSDEDLRTFLLLQYQDNASHAGSFGVFIGALLTRNGFTLDEVVDCATDPVFVAQMIAGQVTPATVSKHALEVFKDVAESESRRESRN